MREGRWVFFRRGTQKEVSRATKRYGEFSNTALNFAGHGILSVSTGRTKCQTNRRLQISRPLRMHISPGLHLVAQIFVPSGGHNVHAQSGRASAPRGVAQHVECRGVVLGGNLLVGGRYL
jgi:hypothetical protein